MEQAPKNDMNLWYLFLYNFNEFQSQSAQDPHAKISYFLLSTRHQWFCKFEIPKMLKLKSQKCDSLFSDLISISFEPNQMI